MFDIAKIKEENALINKYGLKSRREVWRADFEIEKIRSLAKELITANPAEQSQFVEKQAKKGFKVSTVQDVLALNKENRLERRLQSIVAKKFSIPLKLARQLITHKHVKIGEKMISSPKHLVTVEEEANIILNVKIPEKKIISEEERKILEEIKPKEDKNE